MAARSRLSLLAVVAALALAGPAGAAPAPGSRGPALPGQASATGGPVVYAPPVDAPVAEPFRAPATPYGPGNRGIDYAVAPGTVVRAAGAGVVVFAGQVAGELYVTLRHPDGIRTSYSYLARIEVHVGEQVARGQPVGVTTDRFQIGARRGETYVDPALLWAGRLRAFLVPLSG